jgi:hypothetical protein
MMDQREAEALRSKYDVARGKLGPSGPQGEKEFMIAYQNLVKAGLAQQIKRKFRGKM